ncbi:phage tail tape measure C-terminal domain-containing protein [Zoogloea sp. LCSB751]|uniref:phage tail tape measure C-terminal domain-containing protein n=1 Tax=Zoogloea sp. LCSB751 TaxID=1965277 RepID=UPI0009A4BC76|nr:phage tail tape measure C-terminal domain-containing protein [Zoogloea sp. LCSB751]
MASLGSLAVSLSAETANFESALNRAADLTKQFGKASNDNLNVMAQVDAMLARGSQTLTSFGGIVGNDLVSAFDKAKSAMANFAMGSLGIGAGLGVSSIVSQMDKAISSMAELKDMSEKTGARVQALSALSATAKQAGIEMGTVETGLVRMAKAMSGADDEAKGAGQALSALGLSAKDLRQMDTADALKTVADKMSDYRDGAGKTALALDLFGKSGAQLLPFLKELAERQDLVGKVTDEAAYMADHYEKALQRLTAGTSTFYRTLAMDALPTLNTFVDRMNDGTKIAGGFWKALNTFGIGSFLGGAKVDIDEIQKRLADLQAQRTRIMSTVNPPNPEMAAGALRYVEQQIEAVQKQIAFQNLLKEKQERPVVYADNAAAVAKAYASYSTEIQRAAQLALAAANFPDSAIAEQAKPVLKYTPRASPLDDQKIVDTSRQVLDGLLKEQERRIQAEKDLLGQRTAMLDRSYKDDLTSIGSYYADRASAIKQSTDNAAVAYAKEEQILKDFLSRTTDTRLKAEAQNKLADVKDRSARSMQDGSAKLEQNAFDQAKAYEQLGRQLEALDARYQSLRGNAEAAAAMTFDTQNAALAKRLEIEGLTDALDKLQALRDRAIESASTTAEAGTSRAIRAYISDVQNVGKSVESSLTRSFSTMEDALVSFTTTGKLNFKSFSDSIIADIVRIQVRQQMAGMLSGSGGFINAVTGFLGLSTASTSATYSLASGSNLTSMGGGQGLKLPSFDVGTNYVPKDMIAMIHEGEMIVPKAFNAAASNVAGRQGVVVNVVESPGNGGQVQQSQGPGGVDVITVLVERVKGAVAGDIAKSGNIAKIMEQRYGLSPAMGAVR